MKVQRYIKSDWERTDMASGPIWDNGNWRIIEKSDYDLGTNTWGEEYYILRDKSNQRTRDKRFNTLAEAMDFVDFRANLNSSRQIKSSEEVEKQEIIDKIWEIDPSMMIDPIEWTVDELKNFLLKLEKENGYVTSSRKITSARYIATDPETGEVLGSADTYEEAVNEWGEDVTITDSEAAEGQEDMEGGLFSNKRIIKSSLHTEVVENFPEYMVNYAVYGEHLDVTDEDVSLYEEWRERNGYGTCFGTGSVYDESYFSSNPAFGLPCTVIPVVFEVSGSVTSSKKPETTKQFVTRILSELETGEITEDEAAEEIAEANDVNIGYAKQILSNYIADKDRYITSGMLELGDALNVEFDPDGNLDSWSVDFATDPEKPAPTLGGELVRAARYIISAFRDDGEKIGWGYAREMLNPAARFIKENTDFSGVDAITDMLDGNIPDDESYRQWIDEFEVDFADYLRDHEEFFHKLNKVDFTENTSKDDEYSDITEFYVEDEDGNKYWFSGNGEGYTCDTIDYATDPDFTVGDVVTAEDYPYDSIDFDSEFGDFTEEPFDYSWEYGNGESVTISDVRLIGGMFDVNDFVSANEIAEMIDNGTGVYDSEDHELKISDIM